MITNKRHFQALPREKRLKRMKLSNFEACTVFYIALHYTIVCQLFYNMIAYLASTTIHIVRMGVGRYLHKNFDLLVCLHIYVMITEDDYYALHRVQSKSLLVNVSQHALIHGVSRVLSG